MAQVLTAPVQHRFVLELLSPQGGRLHEVGLDRPDFARAVEATFFQALRQGAFSDYAPPLDRARVEPSFADDGPQSAGFEVVLPTQETEIRRRFGLDFFKTLVRRTAAQLAVGGKLDADSLVYRLTAFSDEPAPRPRGGLVLDVEDQTNLIPIREGSRKEHGLSEAWDGPQPADFTVLVPRHVLVEAVAEARATPDREVGGVLLGHLNRDRETGELYLEVTCLVPCEGTQATEISVTFTHETWARVREVAQWRGEGELIVGWSHSHPFRLCAECPSPVPSECQAKVLFYSSDDEFLMELTFARPFMVGLLAAVEPRLEQALGHLPVKLFGWKNGVIAPRGFEVIEG